MATGPPLSLSHLLGPAPGAAGTQVDEASAGPSSPAGNSPPGQQNGSSRTSINMTDLGLRQGSPDHRRGGDDPDDEHDNGRSNSGSPLPPVGTGGRYWQEPDGTRRAVSDAEYRRLRRRVTNRASAQRMRRKRQDDLQTVQDQVAQLQNDNEELREAQRRCVDSMGALKREAMLWRERALHVVRQNSLFVRQQMMRPEIGAWPNDLLSVRLAQMQHAEAAALLGTGPNSAAAGGMPTDPATLLRMAEHSAALELGLAAMPAVIPGLDPLMPDAAAAANPSLTEGLIPTPPGTAPARAPATPFPGAAPAGLPLTGGTQQPPARVAELLAARDAAQHARPAPVAEPPAAHEAASKAGAAPEPSAP